MSLYEGFSIDIEADGFVFESTKIWTIVATDLNNPQRKVKLNPFKDNLAREKLLSFITGYSNPYVAFHYGLGYDVFALLNLLDCPHTVGPDSLFGQSCQFVDTFYLSMFLNPDRAGHSIEYFGEVLGLPKIDYRQALIDKGLLVEDSPKGAEFGFHTELMDEYCERDVDVDIKVFKYLLQEWKQVYGVDFSRTQAFQCGQKAFYLMSCQELTGWKFDIDLAYELQEKIKQMMEEIRAEVEPQLPPRSLKKGEQKDYTMPAKPFKKDGSMSSHMLNFLKKHNGEVLDTGEVKILGKVYTVESQLLLDVKLPMEMANQDQLKDWFLECGWKPSFWNYKRGPDGKPERDPKTRELTPTTPKIQEQGKLCPNLEEMEGDLAKQVVKWLSLRNRQSVLQGWIDNPRRTLDGRIGASRTGITSTHRQKHSVCVNVPKASPKVLLGYEFRSLWICEDGFQIAAADAAALEGRVQGHYTFKYDNGQTADELLKGDPHSKNAVAFYGSSVDGVNEFYKSEGFNKDDPFFKPLRDKSKNGFYCILYGGGAKKVASTLGLPDRFGNSLMESFWEANPATSSLKANLEAYWESTGRKKYLPAVDGRMLCTRKKSALLNTIFQSCGAIAMDYAACFMDKWLGGLKWGKDRKPYYLYKGYKVRRIGYFHK